MTRMERIYVAVRARPLPPEESENSPWRISSNSIFLHTQPSKFEFDRVFGEDCNTVDIFEARTKEIVASVVRGFNGTVFAYGQTSSGKTYTMRGSANEPGIIPLSVHELFCSIQEEMDREFLLRISYMEIYNEEINDLLTPEHRKLQIHESLERGIYVAGLKEEIVNSPEQVLNLVEFGESRRHIGVTNMNLYSSRSHTIFRMIVESRDRSVGDDSFTCFDAVRVSALNLVDLAGSERAGKTGAEGMRLKEGSHINKSLMTLGNVIKKLSDGVESLGGHVPYRDSKLTRILQPALGGNANTAMICNITLSQIHADETKSTLLFASRALQVKNCACVNEILTDAALLKRQKKEIEELRTKLLSSHSEYLEEEILNLRNTLLQSELEKERIALELEVEKKAKAHRERRLLEQAKKIENLSSLILCSERDDKTRRSIQRKRRLTWCPGPFQKTYRELQSNPEADNMEPVEDEAVKSLLHPFSLLVQESEGHLDIIPFMNCSSDDADHTDNLESFSLPDAHALMNVTSRRKNHLSRVAVPLEGDQSAEKVSEFADLIFESDAKLLEDLSNSSKEARLTNEQLLLLFSNQNFTEEFNGGDTTLKHSVSIEDIALHIDLLKNSCDAAFAITQECFQFFVILSEILESFKMLPRWCIVQLKSIVSGHKSINRDMNKKLKEVELDKNILSNQLYNHQKQIHELKSDFENRVNIAAEQGLHHDMEKDELLSQVLYLQKEVSQLSLSSLVWEKDALRKELDKTKLKLKDTDCKLKNVIQEKVKLEGEKAQAERVIKSLQGQQSILERNILKHDSHLDKRRELRSDFNKVRGLKPVAQQNLQDDYEKLEFLSFELEAEISSLKEALEITTGEKENASVKNGNLNSELETMANKLNTAFSEMELLKEELERMEQRLADSESSSKGLEDALDLLSKEKEEMISQLTESLLEVEAEKLGWNSKEKTLIEKLERSNNEIVELSKNLSEVIEELDLCKDQCNSFRERFRLSDGIIKSKKDSSMSKSSEIGRLRDEFDRLGVNTDGNKDEKSNLELVSWQLHPPCFQMHNPRSYLLRVTGEKENLLSKVDKLSLEFEMETLEGKYNELQSNAELIFQELNQRISSFEVEMQEVAHHKNKESSELRMQLSSTQAKLDTYRRRLKEALDERKFMDSRYQEASTKLKNQLRSYGHHILDLTKQLAEKK